jgi:outer membrane murein-binding lipoprotein Lpp
VLKEHEKLQGAALKSNAVLSDLSEDQVNAILTVAHNHFKEVVDSAIKGVHDRYDEDIKELTGKEKPGGVKTYDHLKNVIEELKSGDGSKLQEKITNLEQERDQLREQVKKGAGNDALKAEMEKLEKRLNDKEDELKGVRKQLKEEKETFEERIKAAEAEKMGLGIEDQLKDALSWLQIAGDDQMPEAMRNRFIQAELEAIRKEYDIEMGEDGLVFRKDGRIVPNPENLGNPITASELLSDRLKPVLLTDGGKKGGGVKPGANRNGSGGPGIRGAKNQVEADGMIRKHLQEKGIKPGSKEFTTQHLELRKEYAVGELPVK